MLKEQADRIIVFAAADFEQTVSTCRAVDDAAALIEGALPQAMLGTTRLGYAFRVLDKRLLFIVTSQRLYAQALGLSDWQENIGKYGTIFKAGLEKMGATQLKRAGFKVWAFVSTGMQHAEMVELMFGSFLVPAAELKETTGKIDDVLLQLHGDTRGMKAVTIIAPQTPEQATRQLLQTNNLESFLEEHKLLDHTVKELRDRLATDCLLFDIDLFREDITHIDFPLFLKDALEEADRIVTSCVLRLKDLGKKGR
jgi:hypothetical protein